MSAVTAARFTNEEFDQMVRSGAFVGLGRIELRQGELHRMSPQYAAHMRARLALVRAFDRAIAALGLPLEVGSEATVRFAGAFQPLPDVFLWDGRTADGPIPGGQVRLIVEVADTTLADDLGAKRQEYARAGLPEYWVCDLAGRTTHQFWAPADADFTMRGRAAFDEALAAATIPGLVLPGAMLR